MPYKPLDIDKDVYPYMEEDLDPMLQELYEKAAEVDTALSTLETQTIPSSYESAHSIPPEPDAKRGRLAVRLKGMTDENAQGASNIRVLSVGKNLFDKSKVIFNSAILANTGVLISPNSTFHATDFIRIKPNTNYTISNKGGNSSTAGIAFYDSSKRYISGIAASNNIETHTSPQNAYYLRFSIKQLDGDIDVCQLEESTTATDREEYKGTENLYKTLDGQPITLHRLPNGVYDEILMDSRNVKRNGEHIIKSTDTMTLNTALTNIDVVRFAKSNIPDYKYPTTSTGAENSILVNGWQNIYVSTNDWDNADYFGCVNLRSANNNIDFVVAKGTYPNLAAAQAALTGTKIIYELAQPQILDTNAVPLIAEPGGHVFITSDGCMPSNEISYPLNLGAVVDGVLEGQKEQSRLLIGLLEEINDLKVVVDTILIGGAE